MDQVRNKRATSFRLSPKGLSNIARLSSILGLSQADVVELSTRALGNLFGISMESPDEITTKMQSRIDADNKKVKRGKLAQYEDDLATERALTEFNDSLAPQGRTPQELDQFVSAVEKRVINAMLESV